MPGILEVPAAGGIFESEAPLPAHHEVATTVAGILHEASLRRAKFAVSVQPCDGKPMLAAVAPMSNMRYDPGGRLAREDLAIHWFAIGILRNLEKYWH